MYLLAYRGRSCGQEGPVQAVSLPHPSAQPRFFAFLLLLPCHVSVPFSSLTEVLMLMKSLLSRGYVREVYNWRHKYFFLTPEGLDYLREYLALPEDVVPATHKRRADAPIQEEVEEEYSAKKSSW